jgi:hypothetical protein
MAERLFKTIKHGLMVVTKSPNMKKVGICNYLASSLVIDMEYRIAQSFHHS